MSDTVRCAAVRLGAIRGARFYAWRMVLCIVPVLVTLTMMDAAVGSATALTPRLSGPEGSLALFAGVTRSVTAGPATASPIGADGVAVDASGDVYIADPGTDVVEKVTPGGTLSIFAGTGSQGPPTAGPATSSELNGPQGVAVDSSGNVYIADTGNSLVEKVTPAGTLSVVAGIVRSSGPPTAGAATSSELDQPGGVAVDGTGDIYIADSSNSVVEKVTPTGTLSIFAGIVASYGAPTAGAATSSSLNTPNGVAVDGSGNVYIADTDNSVVEKVTPTGTLSIFAGVVASYGAPTAGAATSSTLDYPYGVAVDSSGNVYIADLYNAEVEKVTASGTLSIFAGTGSQAAPTAGTATNSPLNTPVGVAVDSSGNVYIADTNNDVVEKVAGGTLSIFAGAGSRGAPTAGPATSSKLGGPFGVAVDSSGNVYIADGLNNVVEKVTPAGTLSIIAGIVGSSGPPTAGPATSSTLNTPVGVAVDGAGNVYITDAQNNVVEKVTPAGTLSIFAGIVGSSGPPTAGPATSSTLHTPYGLAIDSAGNVYITDSGNEVVEKVTPSGTLSIIAGIAGSSGPPTAGPAIKSRLDGPAGVAVDGSGNVIIVDFGNDVVEKVTTAGTLSILAGDGTSGAPTAGLATASMLDSPHGVAVDSSGNVYIADASNNLVEKVTPAGTLSIFAGTGTAGPPTPGPAISSKLHLPLDVAVDASGNVYVADGDNSDVEEVFGPGAPTSTRVSCSPASVLVGAPSSCTASVTDTTPLEPNVPPGSVSFSAASGSFGSGATCTLVAAGTSTSSCAVTFTGSQPGSVTVTAAYGGDPSHLASTGTGTVTVSASIGPTGTTGTTAGSGTASVGKSVVSGDHVSTAVSCPASSPTSCTVMGTVTTTATGHAGDSTSRVVPQRKARALVIGRARLTVAPGHTGHLMITLTRVGRRLLAKRGVLHARLVLAQNGKTISSRRVTFHHKRHRPTKRH